ncbi:Hypoxia-responsive family protein [Euphorbia peplus]|nr:Hypoxia-responsive family protein [Euphorbia peplus]
MESVQSWVSKNKLTSIGALWATAVGGSLVYSTSKTPMKPSLRFIHARMHAQAITLAVLSGAAIYHHYERKA